MADLLAALDGGNQPFIDFLWVTVHDTDPIQPRNLIQRIQQPVEGFFPIEIDSVQRCLLRHQDQLPHSLRGQLPGLL